MFYRQISKSNLINTRMMKSEFFAITLTIIIVGTMTSAQHEHDQRKRTEPEELIAQWRLNGNAMILRYLTYTQSINLYCLKI